MTSVRCKMGGRIEGKKSIEEARVREREILNLLFFFLFLFPVRKKQATAACSGLQPHQIWPQGDFALIQIFYQRKTNYHMSSAPTPLGRLERCRWQRNDQVFWILTLSCSGAEDFLQTCLRSVGAQLRRGKGSETPGLCECEDVGIWEKEL